MKNPILFRSLVAAVAFAAVACTSDAPPKSDPALSQDLALANQMQQTQPSLQDAPIPPKPVEAPPPAPAPQKRAPDRIPETPTVRTAPPPPQPPPAPVVQAPAPRPDPVVTTPTPGPVPALAKEIGSGSSLLVTSTGRVCTNANRPGDKIVATLAAPVTGSNGAVIPAGSNVVLEVASVTPGDRPEDARIGFRLRAVVVNNVSYPATGEVTPVGDLERVAVAKPADDKKKVIGGAIAGAIAGKIIGGNTKGAVIGAAAGAATGAAVAAKGQKYDACLAQGASMRVVLNDRIVIT
jgi:hypothetical protein